MGRDYSLKKSAHDEGAVREKCPTGFFTFQITDYKEKNKEGQWLVTGKGDPKILVICEVVNHAEHDGKNCLHSVIFYRPESPSIKGIGMTRNFLKCIDEPWEGDIDPNPSNWIGKRFMAEAVKNGEYINLVDIQPTEQVITGAGPVSAGGGKMSAEERQKAIDEDRIAWDS